MTSTKNSALAQAQLSKPSRDSIAKWILLINFASSSYSVGTVWMAQVSYQLWGYVGPNEFETYHAEWWSRIQPVVFPLAGLSTLASIAMFKWRSPKIPGWMVWLGLALQVAWIGGTIFWWAPLMAQIKEVSGPNADLYHKLLTTHWLRVAFVTGYGLLVLWMMVYNLFAGQD
jgi:hypothetical protein